jgi:hypothetical protein
MIKDLFRFIPKGILESRESLWVCSKIRNLLEKQNVDDYVAPLSFVRGNLTLKVKDPFFISFFKAKEERFLVTANRKIAPFKINKIFYRSG